LKEERKELVNLVLATSAFLAFFAFLAFLASSHHTSDFYQTSKRKRKVRDDGN